MDIKAVAHMAHSYNPDIVVVVDNSFLSPYFQRPLDLGADVVVHSVSKYINGHSDVMMGAMVTNSQAIFNRVKFLQAAIGAVPSPMDCYMAHRGLKTLKLRMQQHEKNAFIVAKYLEASPHISQVLYPGLPSHPQHAIAAKQQHGYGGMISFRLKGSPLQARQLLERLKLFSLGLSLGATESLASLPFVRVSKMHVLLLSVCFLELRCLTPA